MRLRCPPSACVRALAIALPGLLLQAPAWSQDFVPNDVEICPGSAQIRDPEFNSRDKMVTFVDALGRLKVSPVRADATLGLRGCAGRVIDTDVTIDLPGITFLNGPEWARSQLGTELFYAKRGAEGEPRLARAWPNGSGGWSTELLAQGDYRQFPVPSMDEGDPQARIFYWRQNPDLSTTTMWREANAPETEQSFPGFEGANTGGAPRWVQGLRAISTVVTDTDGVRQAAIYFIDTGELRTITSDAGDKDEVWVWQAPEFGNEWVLSTVVDRCCVRIYRQTAGAWNLVNTFGLQDMTSAARAIYSPQPMTYKGRSYLAMQLASSVRYGPSSIWIAAVDPSAPLFRQVSEPSGLLKVRNEPEWYIDRNGAWVFYTQVTATGGFALRRAKSGL